MLGNRPAQHLEACQDSPVAFLAQENVMPRNGGERLTRNVYVERPAHSRCAQLRRLAQFLACEETLIEYISVENVNGYPH